jgi:hypothetical protein
MVIALPANDSPHPATLTLPPSLSVNLSVCSLRGVVAPQPGPTPPNTIGQPEACEWG